MPTFIGLSIGILIVLVDIMLKGFSLRGLSAITFGLAMGVLLSYLVGTSPLFARGDEQIIFIARLALFLASTYLCSVIALRGRDEFNLIIPYVRFVPHEVDVPLVVVDTSVLIDGRIARVCETGFLSSALVIPRFVLRELQSIADSTDAQKQARRRFAGHVPRQEEQQGGKIPRIDQCPPVRQGLVALQALEVAEALDQPGRIGHGIVVVAQEEFDAGGKRCFDAQAGGAADGLQQ